MSVPQARVIDLAGDLLGAMHDKCCHSTRDLADKCSGGDLDRTRRALAWLAEEGDVERVPPGELDSGADHRSWYWRVPEARR
jgi:hypothetical protein